MAFSGVVQCLRFHFTRFELEDLTRNDMFYMFSVCVRVHVYVRVYIYMYIYIGFRCAYYSKCE